MAQAIPADNHKWRDHPDKIGDTKILYWRAYDSDGKFVQVVPSTLSGLERYKNKGWTFTRAGRTPRMFET